MAKNLMTGNEAVARGLYEAGVAFASAYPGTPSTEILENVAEKYKDSIACEWAPNEKVAFEAAVGASFVGGRSFAAMKHVVPHMRAAGRGSIITVASTGGMRWMGYDYPAYAASKAALIELTNSVGLRYAREGIRANSISPGLIETPLIRTSITGHYGSVEEMLAARHAASPTGQMGQPEDVGAAAVFLASQESRYINATCVPVDGGLIHTTSVAAAQH